MSKASSLLLSLDGARVIAMKNIWREHGSQLGPSYVASPDDTRFVLITHALGTLTLPAGAQVLDVGGGFGRQSRLLAAFGLNVLIVDIDDFMLNQARIELSKSPADIAARVRFVKMDIFSLTRNDHSFEPKVFDLVCCHSVLNYLEDLETSLVRLADYVAPGGYLSLLVNMPGGLMVREFLRGQTKTALNMVRGRPESPGGYISDFDHDPNLMIDHLKAEGLTPWLRHGVGFFSELNPFRATGPDSLDNICALDWSAGQNPNLFTYCTAQHIIFSKAALKPNSNV
ncbi:MAG: class I SAM-dependent methyltransferase [Litorimonas sp.]